MTRFAILAAALTAAVLAVTASAGRAGHPKLFGPAGKNGAYKLKLVNLSGGLLKTLKAGTHTVVIHDDASAHNHELDGPHRKSWTFTSVGYVGTKTFTLKLVAGKYKAYCSPHESIMFQHFTVT